jgi:hypothetical protein
MSKILLNNTALPVSIADTGVTVPASGSYTIPPNDYLLWAASSNIVTKVGDSTLTVNDGSFNLSISDGIDLIKGIFQTCLVQTPSVINQTALLANTEYSVALPIGARKFYIRSRDDAKLQLAFTSGQSGTLYITIYPGSTFMEDCIHNASVSLYFQSNKAGKVVEVLYWT